MKVTEEQFKNISKFLESSFNGGAKCPMCGSKDWRVSGRTWNLVDMSDNGTYLMPCVAISCEKCGNIQLFSIDKIKGMDHQTASENGKEK